MGFNLTDIGSILDLDAHGQSTTAEVPVTDLGPGDTFGQPKGTARRYRVALVDPASAAPLQGIFDEATALRAFVWGGEDGPILASPASSWADAPGGLAFVDVTPDDLAPLEFQPYPARLEVDRGGYWQEAWSGWLDVEPTPAVAAAPKVYGAYRDMTRMGGLSIRQLLTADQGAGFVKVRAEARQWLDSIILARYRPPGGRTGPSTYATGLGGYWGPIDSPNKALKGYLDGGKLVVTDLVVDCVTRKALGLLFDRQLDPAWKAMARAEHLRADSLAFSLVAQVDLDGSGYPAFAINCGVFSARDI